MFKMNLEQAEDRVDQEKKAVCAPWQIVLSHQTDEMYIRTHELRTFHRKMNHSSH